MSGYHITCLLDKFKIVFYNYKLRIYTYGLREVIKSFSNPSGDHHGNGISGISTNNFLDPTDLDPTQVHIQFQICILIEQKGRVVLMQ